MQTHLVAVLLLVVIHSATGTDLFQPANRDELKRAIDACLGSENTGLSCEKNGVHISLWDTSQVSDISGMFKGASEFHGDVSAWDVSNVKNMREMFQSAHNFDGDVSKWNVSEVTNMEKVFNMAHKFNGILSKWDVSKVTSMDAIFEDASSFNPTFQWDCDFPKRETYACVCKHDNSCRLGGENTAATRFERFFDLETGQVKDRDCVHDWHRPECQGGDIIFSYNSDTLIHGRYYFMEGKVAASQYPMSQYATTTCAPSPLCDYVNQAGCPNSIQDRPANEVFIVVRTFEENYYKVRFLSEDSESHTVSFEYEQIEKCGSGLPTTPEHGCRGGTCCGPGTFYKDGTCQVSYSGVRNLCRENRADGWTCEINTCQ